MNIIHITLIKRFDSYTKVAFRHCLYHIRLNRQKVTDNETILNIEELQFSFEDDYSFIDNKVKIMGFDMIIKNDLLYEALNSLEQSQRDVIYLSICKKLSDLKIGTIMNMSRSKVQRTKVKATKMLKEMMKGDAEGGKW